MMLLSNNIPAPELSDFLREHLEGLTNQLQAALGENLLSLVIHGSLPRGEFRPGTSDIDVLIVLEEISPQVIEVLSGPLRLARDAARIESLILLRKEMAGSHDVFPLFYDEIKDCHWLLAGAPPFDGIKISDEHRRLRIEQELREINTRLRRLGVDAMGNNPLFAGALEHKLRQLRFVLLSLLRLRGIQLPDTKLTSVYTAACKRWSTPLMPLLNVSENPARAFAALSALLALAIDDVDQVPS